MKPCQPLPAPLEAIRQATCGTPFAGDLYLVGGAVRDAFLGRPAKDDFDLVTRGSAPDLAEFLFTQGVSQIWPVTYPRFGTAMVHVGDTVVELVTARRESYDASTRKPNVVAATYEEDAQRRDFTINTLMVNLHSGDMWDPLGRGVADLEAGILRTPLDPVETFHDDPLRMLRAVRFRARFNFTMAPGLPEAIRDTRDRLRIVSMERIRDEFLKMLSGPSASEALRDLMDLGLMEYVAPEFLPMVGCEQGYYHHLDVWDHTRLVVEKVGSGDLLLTLGALFHDVAKPETRFVDDEGNVRFFGHEAVGQAMTHRILRHLKLPQRDIETVGRLVKNHMRLGSSPTFSKSAARRVLRDMGDDTDRLLALVEADCASLRPGVRVMDLAPIRAKIDEVRQASPVEMLCSPLSGREIMELLGVPPGPEVGKWKNRLTEQVIEGEIAVGDKDAAVAFLRQAMTSPDRSA